MGRCRAASGWLMVREHGVGRSRYSSITHGDLTGDGSQCAAVDLIYNTGGTARRHYLSGLASCSSFTGRWRAGPGEQESLPSQGPEWPSPGLLRGTHSKATCEVVDQILEGNARLANAGSPIYDLRVADDDRLWHRRPYGSVAGSP